MKINDPIKAKVVNIPSIYDLPKTQEVKQTNATWEYRLVGSIAFFIILAIVVLLFN